MTSPPDLPAQNRRIVLAAYPAGAPRTSDFRLETVEKPKVQDGEVLIRLRWLSVDPMVRIFINDKPMAKGGRPPLPFGTVIPGAGVGEVVESRRADLAVGTLLEGRFGWQDYAVSTGADARRVDPEIGPPETALGVLGLPGFTAYVGLRLGGCGPGQTVVVSGAAGAVGSAVAPLARAQGARAVGLVRGEAKTAYLRDELGYDAVVDWSGQGWREQLEAALPNGADIYFDNVGGDRFADVLPLMAKRGRVIVCGLMAQYNGVDGSGVDRLPETLTAIMGRSLSVQAFSNVDHAHLRPDFLREVGAMVRSGAMPARTHVEDGLEATPAAFVRLFTNGVAGKVLVRV